MRILEKLAWPDSLRTIRRLHQIVAFLAAMFPPERIHEDERTVELLCLDQKFAAIGLPFPLCFVHVYSPLGEGVLILLAGISPVAGTIFCFEEARRHVAFDENHLGVNRIYSRGGAGSIP
jgi:hypothetical protein